MPTRSLRSTPGSICAATTDVEPRRPTLPPSATGPGTTDGRPVGAPTTAGGTPPGPAASPSGVASPARLVPLLKVGVWLGALVPLGLLGWGLAGGFHVVDPVEEIQRRTGIAILVLLLLTLSITPLRRLTGWNPLIRFRRLLGNFAFFYATLHAFSYFVFDQELSPVAIAADVAEHPWVLVGFLAFVLLIPLAATSTNGMIRRMGGKNWRRLHLLIYPIAILGVLHFWWLVKADVSEPAVYAAILSLLLVLRIPVRRILGR